MRSNTITTIELLPDEGKYLTQATLPEGEERIFSESVYCPSGQENNWIEVDAEYKAQWEADHPVEMPGEEGAV